MFLHILWLDVKWNVICLSSKPTSYFWCNESELPVYFNAYFNCWLNVFSKVKLSLKEIVFLRTDHLLQHYFFLSFSFFVQCFSLQAWQSFVLRCQLVFKLVKPWQHICPNSNWCICHKHLITVCSSDVQKRALLFHVTKSSQLSEDLRNGRWLLIFGLSHFSWVPYCSLLLIP